MRGFLCTLLSALLVLPAPQFAFAQSSVKNQKSVDLNMNIEIPYGLFVNLVKKAVEEGLAYIEKDCGKDIVGTKLVQETRQEVQKKKTVTVNDGPPKKYKTYKPNYDCGEYPVGDFVYKEVCDKATKTCTYKGVSKRVKTSFSYKDKKKKRSYTIKIDISRKQSGIKASHLNKLDGVKAAVDSSSVTSDKLFRSLTVRPIPNQKNGDVYTETCTALPGVKIDPGNVSGKYTYLYKRILGTRVSASVNYTVHTGKSKWDGVAFCTLAKANPHTKKFEIVSTRRTFINFKYDIPYVTFKGSWFNVVDSVVAATLNSISLVSYLGLNLVKLIKPEMLNNPIYAALNSSEKHDKYSRMIMSDFKTNEGVNMMMNYGTIDLAKLAKVEIPAELAPYIKSFNLAASGILSDALSTKRGCYNYGVSVFEVNDSKIDWNQACKLNIQFKANALEPIAQYIQCQSGNLNGFLLASEDALRNGKKSVSYKASTCPLNIQLTDKEKQKLDEMLAKVSDIVISGIVPDDYDGGPFKYTYVDSKSKAKVTGYYLSDGFGAYCEVAKPNAVLKGMAKPRTKLPDLKFRGSCGT